MNDSGHAPALKRPEFVPFREATDEIYRRLGFRCGLEIHQQLDTDRKLFCRCPAGHYQDAEDFDAQLVRHMRPTLSELGEYDGTALMEFKTRKNITYRIKGETACTYDMDDTPPFPMNREALSIAIEMALLLDLSLVGELHVTRKQYLDGSIPTGFQRTAIVGIEGHIPVADRRVGLIQLSIEEDSCREVLDVGHDRVYTTDRLGMPLIETVTYPDLRTPHEAAEAADFLRFVARSTGRVRTGLGAARQDVNVSIDGGTRVEIKGVQRIRHIPRLTHLEAFRQNALLGLRDELQRRIEDPCAWHADVVQIPADETEALADALDLPEDASVVAMTLPGFADLLSTFLSPDRTFADELSDRLKVVACIEKPNLLAGEVIERSLPSETRDRLFGRLGHRSTSALLVFWGPQADLATAIETLEERCRLALDGVPNETRRACLDGTTRFERVLPGPDRMYPDTDSAPIPIHEEDIAAIRSILPSPPMARRFEQLMAWEVPDDVRRFLLRHNLFERIAEIALDTSLDPKRLSTLYGHVLRHAWHREPQPTDPIPILIEQVKSRGLAWDLLNILLPLAVDVPTDPFDDLLARAGYAPHTEAEIDRALQDLLDDETELPVDPEKRHRWIMGRLRPLALGNLPLRTLAERVERALA